MSDHLLQTIDTAPVPPEARQIVRRAAGIYLLFNTLSGF